MSAEMQMQVRRNIEQMHETVDDISGWLGDIGKKDANLRGKEYDDGGAGGADDGTDSEEEAREIEEAKAELRRLASEQEAEEALDNAGTVGGGGSSKSGAAGAAGASGAGGGGKAKGKAQTHAQKYGQWEQYDADAIVKRMEAREADQERLRKEVVRLENARAIARARKRAAVAEAASEALKARGNSAFGAARYEDAVGYYTDALEQTPRSAVLYANRALALLKLNAVDEAAEDCDAALLIDPLHVKALFRRAQARRLQKKYEGALEDLEKALELEPKDRKARELMAECRRLRTDATPKPAKPMQRAAIEEVEHDPDNDNDPFVLVTRVAPDEADEPEGATGAADSGADPSSPAGQPGQSSAAAAATTAATAALASPAAKAAAAASVTADSLGQPTTLADIERAHRTLRRTAEQFALYVRRIPPPKLASILKSSLPSDLFSALLAAIDSDAFFPDDAARAAELMLAMSGAGRFSILTMCLDKADSRAIASIFDRLDAAQAADEVPADVDLRALRKKYA